MFIVPEYKTCSVLVLHNYKGMGSGKGAWESARGKRQIETETGEERENKFGFAVQK